LHTTHYRRHATSWWAGLTRTLSGLAVGLVFLAGASAHAGAEDFDAAMSPILATYLEIHDTLASDQVDGVAERARSIGKAAGMLDPTGVTGKHADHYKTVPEKLGKAAAAMSEASDLAEAREALKELSKPLAMWATMSKPEGISVVYCSMAKASWLQKGGSVRNPYYGASMLTCGQVVSGAGK
jgi:hypothetical protein